MWNPRVAAEITPAGFEQLVVSWLRQASATSDVAFEVAHSPRVGGQSGAFQIDAVAKFAVFGGAEVIVLVECKHKGRPVDRDAVMLLEAKLRETAAHKGILFSTSGFQKGALEYATTHGIATVTVIEGKWLYETKAAGTRPVEPPPWVHFDDYAGWRVTAEPGTISCHTITMADIEALSDWLAGPDGDG